MSAEQLRAELERVKAERDSALATWHAEERDHAKTRAKLERIRNYSPLAGSGCPLCEYKDGVFIDYCAVNENQSLAKQLAAANRREAKLRQAIDNLLGLACEFIGPDEDGNPECTCCGMSLETPSKGHRQDCLANAILGPEIIADLQPDAGTLSADCRANQTAALSQTSPGAGSAAISQSALQPDAGK